MEVIKKIYNNKIIAIFMIIQPLIDVITYFMKLNYDLIVTYGMVFRLLFFIYVLFYLVFFDKNKRNNNYFYLFCIFLVFLVNIILNYYSKYSYDFFEEIKNITKICYFPATLLFFVKYNKNNEDEILPINILSVNLLIISLVLLISKLTVTQFCSYANTIGCVDGSSGWFYSANELSMILVLLFPICLHKCIKSKFRFFDSITLILAVYSLLEVGTKSAYIGLILILIIYLFFWLIKLIKNTHKNILKNIGIIFTIILMIFILTPGTSVCYNNLKLFENYNIYCKIPLTSDVDNNLERFENYIDIINGKEKNDQVFNGREEKLKQYKEIYKKNTILQKIFGVGYKNFYSNNKNIYDIIEMDFHDLFYGYGYAGFIIILLPLFILISQIIFKIFRKITNFFNDENIILIGVFLCLIGAYISGHVLFSSAVVIYINYIISYFAVDKKYN